MSHTVTVTRTTTSTTSAIIINTGYFKTWPGILKFVELVLGIINVGLVSYEHKSNRYDLETLFFLLMSTTFMVGTFLLVLSCLVSISTASILPKTIHEFIYHIFGFLMILIGSAVFISVIYQNEEVLYAAAIMGFILSALYLVSAVFAYRSYKGI